jgi:hypothetical protein
MDVIENILEYFAKDPLRLLTLLGGSGGIAYWISLYKNRSRLRVRILKEILLETPDHQNGLEFEAESFGSMPTSLEPTIILTGYTPKRRLRSLAYHVESQDRSLSPHVPKLFKATIKADDVLPFLWYKTYLFRPTRGRARRIRIQSANGLALSQSRFLFERLAFCLFGKLPNEIIR